MEKYDLLRLGDNIIRVLEVQENRVLVIDCIKRRMPVWVEAVSLETYLECSDRALFEVTGIAPVGVDTLDAKQRKVMYERYTMIAPVLSFLADDTIRSRLIQAAAVEHGMSKQTIRNYLCLYLAYFNMTILAPKHREDSRELTQDEKNIRWALNKFFYTTAKQSLMTAYTMMLKGKYCDKTGTLVDKYPSFYQFRYFYRKTRKMQNFHISRNGLKHYQRNNRPLTGEGVQQFAPSVGVGMLDATVCDIYLVNEAGGLVGRPILTACVDAYSGLCCGYALSWEGGVYSLRGLMINVIADKVSWCKQFGISVHVDDWPCHALPAVLVTDMGTEFTSETFEQIAELGVKVVNLPSYRPELKGLVEKFFDMVQSSYKKHLKGKGVIEPDFQERGAHDYRKDACLTMDAFEKIIVHCILYYNAQRVVANFPFTEAMIAAGVRPYASCIWNWGISQIGANLIEIGKQELVLTLLPRTAGKFSRYGMKVNQLRYHRDGYTEQYLKGGEVTVAYNPDNVSSVWLIEDGAYLEFTLIESRYCGMDLTRVENLRLTTKAITKDAASDQLQAQIDLARHIEVIASGVRNTAEIRLKNIRSNRKQEQTRHHRDYMKGVDYE